MKYKSFFVVFAVVFCMLLCGCDKAELVQNTDPLEVIQDIPDVSGVKISEGQVILEVSSECDEILLTEEVLLTNTTEINVSVSGLKGVEEIEVYLYDAEYMDHYIAATTLTTTQTKFTFSNLISITGYRIGAKPANLLDGKSLIITD